MINENKQRAIYVVADFLATAIAWFVFNYIRFVTQAEDEGISSFTQFLTITPVIAGQILFPLMMVGLYWLSGYYNRVFLKSRIEEFATTLTTAAFGSVIIFFAAIVDDPIPDKAQNYELLLMLFALLFTFVYIERLIITGINNKRIAQGKIYYNALLVCNLADVTEIKQRLESGVNHMSHAFRIVGVLQNFTSTTERQVATQTYKIPAELNIVEFDHLQEFCSNHHITRIIIYQQENKATTLLPLINKLLLLDIPIMVTPSLVNMLWAMPKLNRIVADPLIDITRPNIAESTINIKRSADVIVSALAMFLLIPAYIVIGAMIKLDSRGSIFYTQTRIGKHRKPFKIIKFRTMVPDAEASGPQLSTENDTRITRIGAFLRKYRLDELPQFFNVFRGNMSLVGPRPERDYYLKQIKQKAPYYTLLHCMRPGLTSLGMVKYGYASSVDEMIRRMHYDLIYLENVSFTTDLKIIVYTLGTVVSGKGL